MYQKKIENHNKRRNDEEQKKVEKHDLDKSCDSYGVRIEKSSESEISDGIPEPVDNAGPRKR